MQNILAYLCIFWQAMMWPTPSNIIKDITLIWLDDDSMGQADWFLLMSRHSVSETHKVHRIHPMYKRMEKPHISCMYRRTCTILFLWHTPLAYFTTNQMWSFTPPSGSHCKGLDDVEINQIMTNFTCHRMKPLVYYHHTGSWRFLKFLFCSLVDYCEQSPT